MCYIIIKYHETIQQTIHQTIHQQCDLRKKKQNTLNFTREMVGINGIYHQYIHRCSSNLHQK